MDLLRNAKRLTGEGHSFVNRALHAQRRFAGRGTQRHVFETDSRLVEGDQQFRNGVGLARSRPTGEEKTSAVPDRLGDLSRPSVRLGEDLVSDCRPVLGFLKYGVRI